MSGVFRVLSYGEDVGEGDSGAMYCTLGAIVKRPGPDHPMLALNELIAFRIGLLLGLPVIAGVVVAEPSGVRPRSYLSLRFGPENELPPPVIPEELVRDDPEAACGVVVFDCLIANVDRHDRNIAYQPDRIALSLFDHDRAILGKNGLDRLEGLRHAHCLNTHCIAAALADGSYFQLWLQRAELLQPHTVRAIVAASATEAGVPSGLGPATADIICHRRDRLGAMLTAAFTERLFPRMGQAFFT